MDTTNRLIHFKAKKRSSLFALVVKIVLPVISQRSSDENPVFTFQLIDLDAVVEHDWSEEI